MKKLIIIAALSCSSAFAWGPREQGALAGFVVGSIVNNGIRASAPVYQPQYPSYQPTYQYQYPTQVYIQPQPVYVQPQRHYICNDYQDYDKYGRPYGTQRICH